MKRIISTLMCILPLSLFAQGWTEADTLYVNDAREEVAQKEATLLGVVKRVDEETNVATVQYFDRTDSHLVSVERRVASGPNQGLRKGKQLYFDADGKVESMFIYTLVHNESNGKSRSRLASETFLYPDGKTSEEVTLTYPESAHGEQRMYERKCYYPDGQLQYMETLGEKEVTTVYYNEDGKETKRPKQKFELYMTMPEFPGGQSALFRYLATTVKYPPVAQANGIQGRVIVQFVVAKDGKVENVEVVRSGGDPSLDKEALRVIRHMPRWTPGKERGKPVRVKYTVPVNFRLQ